MEPYCGYRELKSCASSEVGCDHDIPGRVVLLRKAETAEDHGTTE